MIPLSWTREELLKSTLPTLVKTISPCGLVHQTNPSATKEKMHVEQLKWVVAK